MSNSFEVPRVDDVPNDETSSFGRKENITPEEQKQLLLDNALFSTLKDLPRSNFEQRRDLYEEVENFLFKGFLSETVTIDNIPLSLKTVSANDLNFMKSLTYPGMLMTEWKMICIAKSIWMWDGYNLLEDQNVFPFLRTKLQEMSVQTIDYLYSIYIVLLKKEGENQENVEYFSLEGYSRRMWKIYQKYELNSRKITGIMGTENLPLNTIQRLWIMYNQTQDEIEEHTSRWDLVKASMSPHAHKEIKRLNTRDEAKKKEQEKRRQAQLDHFYYKKIGVLKEQEFMFKDALTRLKSVDELAQEYKNWVEGVKDNHDLIVQQWKVAIANKMRQEEERLQTAQNEMFNYNYEEPEEKVRIVAYTKEQLVQLGIIGKDTVQRVQINDAASVANQKHYVKKQLERDGTLELVPEKPKLKNTGNPPTMAVLDKLNK